MTTTETLVSFGVDYGYGDVTRITGRDKNSIKTFDIDLYNTVVGLENKGCTKVHVTKNNLLKVVKYMYGMDNITESTPTMGGSIPCELLGGK